MDILADESIDAPIVARLRDDGHLILFITTDEPGATDERVLAFARMQDALLLTGDKDFGEMVFRQRLISSGIVLVRLPGLRPRVKAERVGNVFRKRADVFRGNFTVISAGQVRVRPLNYGQHEAP